MILSNWGIDCWKGSLGVDYSINISGLQYRIWWCFGFLQFTRFQLLLLAATLQVFSVSTRFLICLAPMWTPVTKEISTHKSHLIGASQCCFPQGKNTPKHEKTCPCTMTLIRQLAPSQWWCVSNLIRNWFWIDWPNYLTRDASFQDPLTWFDMHPLCKVVFPLWVAQPCRGSHTQKSTHKLLPYVRVERGLVYTQMLQVLNLRD